MLNDTSSALSLLQTRRSGRPRDLVEPGPDAEQLREIVKVASRTPDHGKLAPWRFVHVPREKRGAFAQLLHQAFRVANPEPSRAEEEAVDRLAYQAPTLVVVLSSPIRDHKIPVWEQELSCGAACMNLLHAAHAMGFAGGWITGWSTYSEEVRRAFAHGEDERIAGLLYIGTPAHPLEERPRPSLDHVLSEWNG
ncbi:MAG TPA: nitroreductase [Allosphingosinicella sp.]|uniref:nitroreductase family protein n=1 Tax=Allosphingosinicella sp. TaxID=2823234 RepID=UPI002ED91DDC